MFNLGDARKGMACSLESSNSKHTHPMLRTGTTPTNHSVGAAVALRLSDALCCRLRFGFLFRSSLKNFSLLKDVPRLKGVCHEGANPFTGLNCFQWSSNAFSGTLMGFSFFSGDQSGSHSKYFGKPLSKTSPTDLSDGTQWTNILLAANVVVYAAQSVSKGKLLHWGAKINSLISKGQLWRLVTSSFLHANIGHLLINCYSLSAVGPATEKLCGPERYLTVYMSSAVASSAMSYWFTKGQSVGASGAIFGLVGSYVVYLLRHRDMIQGTDDALKNITLVVLLNMAIGLLIPGIDNWGHVGGFIGGAAVSWFVGPAWELQSVSPLGKKTYDDKAPIFSLIGKHPK